MLRTLFALFLFGSSLLLAFDDENASFFEVEQNDSVPTMQKALYLNYVHVPKRVIKGEIFSITIKTLSVVPDFEDIEYTFANQRDLEILNDQMPKRQREDHFFLDTFYFQATGTNVRLPDITATLVGTLSNAYLPASLPGKTIEAIALNPKEDFCNIIANDFVIKRYKTTSYDDKHNIVVFVAEANQTFLKDFHLNDVFSQGFESLNDTIEASRMTYYAVINKKKENLHFSYFNILKNSYLTLNIPIIVEEDKVTTQSDLKPKDNSKKRIKMLIAVAIILLGVVLLLWRQRYIYIVLILIPGVYVIYLMIPQPQVCIKAKSKIRILPLENGTIFEVTSRMLRLDKIGSTQGFVKVELPNKKIGWVKNEDLCSH